MAYEENYITHVESIDEVVRMCCAEGMQSSWRHEKRDQSMFAAGFLGYPYCDEGYGAMEAIRTAGFKTFAEHGSWPYVWAMVHDEAKAIATYCEGDFGVEVFDTTDALNAKLDEMRAEYEASEQ